MIVKTICNFTYQGIEYKQDRLIQNLSDPQIDFLMNVEAVEEYIGPVPESLQPQPEEQSPAPSGFPSQPESVINQAQTEQLGE